jgi:hypothetical protein
MFHDSECNILSLNTYPIGFSCPAGNLPKSDVIILRFF